MAKDTLEQLYAVRGGKVSDKWALYLREYERVLKEFQEQPINILEIGVQNGGSLEIWAQYFPNSLRVIGCDINPACGDLRYDDERVHIVIGDANSDQTQATILSLSATFDIIIDDGSHRSGDIVGTFLRYLPYLADGGIFIAEDLHASYWQEYGGGLYYPYSALMLFKRLVDIIHHEHWGVTKSRVDILAGFLTKYKMHSVWEDALQHVHSVEFVNSMCIVRKARAESNQLGARILRGSDAMIEPGTAWAGGQVSQAPDQSSNWWATLPSPPDEELPRQIEKAAMLELTAEALMARIESMQQATSWRITAPLRRLGDFLTTITKRNHINSSMTKDVPPRQE